MRHDERHAALAAYAFWCKLEQTGGGKERLLGYYSTLFDVDEDLDICPACVIAERLTMARVKRKICDNCPCDWRQHGNTPCLSTSSPFRLWQKTEYGSKDEKKRAGDVSNIMRKWCERVGVIAPREEEK